MKTQRDGSRSAANAVLEQTAQIASQVPGGFTAIAAELTRITGDSFTRKEVHAWLNPSVEKRVEPKLGIALNLIVAAERVSYAHDKAAAKEAAKQMQRTLRELGIGGILPQKARVV